MRTKGDETANSNVNRRNVLLGGTTLAAASAMGSGVSVKNAQAQQPPASIGQRPNIIVIMGDDIGMWNIGRRGHAVH